MTNSSYSYAIGFLESQRLWAYWLGLPVPPRLWKFHTSKPDEVRDPGANPHHREL